ncbi:hypothetical protein [Mesorhizobium sp. M0323]|uniref:hypothetical protein n=1 Tax=Mesorhizobium sp. M0323 TaxID=2956938 RepID=UPI00333D8692
MRGILGGLIALLTIIAPSGAWAQNSCDSVLAGAHNVRIVESQEQYVQDTVRWVRSQRFGSEQQARTTSANFGVSLPVEGIPVNFTSAFQKGEFGSKTWGEAFADYLETNTQEARRYYEAVQTRDPGSIKAWSECIQIVNTKSGLHCWTYPTEDADEVGLMIKFIPEKGKQNETTITAVELVNLRSTVNLIGKKVFLQEEPYVAQRTSIKAGRIEIESADGRCVARVAPVLPKPPEVHGAPCTRTVAGKCESCRFSLSEDTPGGQKFEKKSLNESTTMICDKMAPSSKVKVTLSGTIRIDGSGPPWGNQVSLGLTGCDGGEPIIAKSIWQTPATSNLVVRLDKQFQATTSDEGTCRIGLIYILEDTNEPSGVNGRTLSATPGTTIEVRTLN